MTRDMTRTLNSNRKGGRHDTRRHARPSSNTSWIGESVYSNYYDPRLLLRSPLLVG